MKLLIVGGDGMLGHQLLHQWTGRHDVKATVRKGPNAYQMVSSLITERLICNVDVRFPEALEKCIATFQPDAIVNAAGIVKQRAAATDTLLSLEVNAVFPHRLASMAKSVNARVIHVSTDCVFSGTAGNYIEESVPDPVDVYGRTKLLGELHQDHCITLRTSIIGRELFHKEGLLEWFLRQEGVVRGFTHAIYSGFTTIELGRIIELLLKQSPAASGLWHVSSDPITKYELLRLFKKHYRRKVEIVPDDKFKCDRSLNSTRFRSRFHYRPPAWDDMVAEIARDGEYE